MLEHLKIGKIFDDSHIDQDVLGGGECPGS